MADDPDEWTAEDEAEHLAEVKERLREGRLELARTLRALRRGRRTPGQVRTMIDRAKRVLYRSVVVRRKHEQSRRVH
jgi:hypothetical protein